MLTVRATLVQASVLLKLNEDFVARASYLSRVLVDDIHLPVEKRRLQPRQMGGIAGGEKYLEEGIFFKFALDVSPRSSGVCLTAVSSTESTAATPMQCGQLATN
jgi:hypothetical protein